MQVRFTYNLKILFSQIDKINKLMALTFSKVHCTREHQSSKLPNTETSSSSTVLDHLKKDRHGYNCHFLHLYSDKHNLLR